MLRGGGRRVGKEKNRTRGEKGLEAFGGFWRLLEAFGGFWRVCFGGKEEEGKEKLKRRKGDRTNNHPEHSRDKTTKDTDKFPDFLRNCFFSN